MKGGIFRKISKSEVWEGRVKRMIKDQAGGMIALPRLATYDSWLNFFPKGDGSSPATLYPF
jgi:hypothetical protein